MNRSVCSRGHQFLKDKAHLVCPKCWPGKYTNEKGENQLVDEYLATFSEPIFGLLQQLRKLIHEIAPDAIETMSYGIPTFDLNKKHLVHFAGYAHHIGFYPTPDGIQAFADELKSYQTSKGAVQLPLDQPLPTALIKTIVKHRVAQVLNQK